MPAWPRGGLGVSYGLSTLETIVADFGDNLSPKTATVAEFGDCRQKTGLATVAEFGDYSRQCGQAFSLPRLRVVGKEEGSSGAGSHKGVGFGEGCPSPYSGWDLFKQKIQSFVHFIAKNYTCGHPAPGRFSRPPWELKM